MANYEPTTNLKECWHGGRGTRLWKLSGVSRYDTRRLLDATGTNLVGFAGHKCYLGSASFHEIPGHPSGEGTRSSRRPIEPNGDPWATPDGSR
jgi:hypothetical protein